MAVSLELVRQERPGGGRSAFRAREAAQEERSPVHTKKVRLERDSDVDIWESQYRTGWNATRSVVRLSPTSAGR
jgi:uncharacterized protein YpmB